ncbi:MAG: hypothetical protein AAF321_00505 [Pseudomonadota bacterium]
MSIATLSAVARTNISAMRTLSEGLGQAQVRLATGQRYSGLLENPAAVFDARGMRGRSDTLQSVVDQYARPRGAIQAASSGLSAVTGLVGQLETLARRIEQATPAEIGTPATPATPGSGPQTLISYSKQINLDGNGNVVAGDAKTVAERAILGPWQENQFANGTVKDDIFTNNARAYVPHVSQNGSAGGGDYTSLGQKNGRVDRIRVTATDGTTTISHDFYIGHATKPGVDLEADYTPLDPLDPNDLSADSSVYTIKQLVQGISHELGGYLRAEVTANGRIQFEAAGDFTLELIERSPNPSSPTKPWDSLTNLLGDIHVGDGDMTTDLDTFEFATGPGSSANIGTGNNAGNYEIAFNPGQRPTGGFSAVTPATPGSDATGLLAEWEALVGQIEQVVADSGFDGVNLLRGGESIQLSERYDADRFSLGSLSASLSALGISRSDADFSTPAAISERLDELTGARERIGAMGYILSSASGVVDAREAFSTRMMATLEDGADDLTLADPNAEAARMLAYQTRLDLAASALSLGAQTKPFLLTHYESFGGGGRSESPFGRESA